MIYTFYVQVWRIWAPRAWNKLRDTNYHMPKIIMLS